MEGFVCGNTKLRGKNVQFLNEELDEIINIGILDSRKLQKMVRYDPSDDLLI